MLPLAPQAKRPLTSRGLLEASLVPDIIRGWWARWPTANVGLRTGVMFDVLDIDGEEGRASLEATAGPGTEHPGPVSRTGKGEHWLYLPGGTANRANMLPKLDWRGTNGYIVAPPSVHPDGHHYEWANGPDLELPPIPDWLLPLMQTWVDKTPYVEPNIRVVTPNPYNPHASKDAKVIDARTLARIRTDIVAMARELGYTVEPSGPRWAMQCIFHEGDHEASLMMYPHNNTFYCFGCGAWGDAFNLRDRRPGGHRA